MKPRLLDLFCKAGGAGEGYRRAGFDVTGVDIEPQPRNPHTFIQADAVEYLDAHGHEFDALHASPPCQSHSTLKAMHKDRQWKCYIETIRERFLKLGKPWVIENVEGAPLRPWSDLFGTHGATLCGSMFGLGTETHDLRRHRIFETSFPTPQPPCRHTQRPTIGVYGHSGGFSYRDGTKQGTTAERAKALGIDWMTGDELSQAIPPAYTQFIGRYLLEACSKTAPRQSAPEPVHLPHCDFNEPRSASPSPTWLTSTRVSRKGAEPVS